MLESAATFYHYQLFTDALATAGGAEIDFSNTLALQSITFTDGTTPESHGFDLVFGFGMESPNLAITAVPEPTSLALWGMGMIGLGFGRFRRRLSSQPVEA